MNREKFTIYGMIAGIVLLSIGTFLMAYSSTSEYRANVEKTPQGGATRIAN